MLSAAPHPRCCRRYRAMQSQRDDQARSSSCDLIAWIPAATSGCGAAAQHSREHLCFWDQWRDRGSGGQWRADRAPTATFKTPFIIPPGRGIDLQPEVLTAGLVGGLVNEGLLVCISWRERPLDMSYVPLGVVETMAERALRLGPAPWTARLSATPSARPSPAPGLDPTCRRGNPLVPGSPADRLAQSGAGAGGSATAQRRRERRGSRPRTARAKPGGLPARRRQQPMGLMWLKVRGGGYGTRVLGRIPGSYEGRAGLSVVNGGALTTPL